MLNTNKTFAEIIESLEDNTAPETLNMATMPMSASGVSIFADALSKNTSVKKAWFNHCYIADSQAKLFASVLQLNKTITEIDFSNCNICDKGAADLSSALAINTTLKVLSLRNNGVGDKGAISLSCALSVSNYICSFDISGNILTALGARHLWSAAISNKNIISFSCIGHDKQKTDRIALRLEGVKELAKEWIKYKDEKVPLSRPLWYFEVYASGVEYLLDTEFLKPELARPFKQDYEAQKSTTTFWVAYGVTKGHPTNILADASSVIGGYLKHSDILQVVKDKTSGWQICDDL